MKTTAKKTAEEKMVEKFQCPGCVCGMDVGCRAFKLWNDYGASCSGHVAGTRLMAGGRINLGLPKGFNKLGDFDSTSENKRVMIRLWVKGTKPEWDRLNVAVWAMEEDGHLFVRTYSPRVNKSYVDIIEGGKLSDVPGAINVAEFQSEID